MAQKFCDRGRKTTFATLSLLQCQTLVGSPSARHKAADLGPAGGRARTSPQGDSGTLKVTAEQEYIIREIILKHLNVQKQNSVPEAIGDFVPDEVKPYPLPPEVIQKVPRFNLTSFS